MPSLNNNVEYNKQLNKYSAKLNVRVNDTL